MVSGTRAFRGDSAVDTMSAILHEDPPELSGSNPNVAPAVDRIVRHCLEKNPEERFQSARDVAFDLQTISGLSGSTPPITKRRAKRQWIAIACVGAACIVLGAAAMRLLTPRATRARARSLTQLTFLAGRERFPSLSPDAKSFVFVSDSAGNSDIYLKRVDGQNASNLTKDSPADDTQPAFSPDGERIVFRSERNGGG